MKSTGTFPGKGEFSFVPPKSFADNSGRSALAVCLSFSIVIPSAVICCLFQIRCQVQKWSWCRCGVHPVALKLLSNSRMDPVLSLCNITDSRVVRTWGLGATGNSSLLEVTSYQRLMLMHCSENKRQAEFPWLTGMFWDCCREPLSSLTSELFLEFALFFRFLVVVGIWCTKAGRILRRVDPVGRVFLTLSQHIILVSPRAGDPLPWGYLSCLGEN